MATEARRLSISGSLNLRLKRYWNSARSRKDVALDVANDGVGPTEALQFFGVAMLGGDDRLVGAAGLRHRAKAAEAVRHDARCRLQMRTRHFLDLVAVMRRHHVQQQTQRPPVIAGFDGDHERGLVRPRTPAFAAIHLAFLAAEHHVIHLDATVELAAAFALDHHRHQLVAHQRRRVRAHAELPCEFEEIEFFDCVSRYMPWNHLVSGQQRARENRAGLSEVCVSQSWRR